MNRRVLIWSLVGCGGLLVLGLLLAGCFAVVATIGSKSANDTANDGAKGETTNAQKQESESPGLRDLVLRVSGDQGTQYRCSYNTAAFEEGEPVVYNTEESGTLGTSPVDYTAQLIDSSGYPPTSFQATCATMANQNASRGRLKAEVLVDQIVKDEDETRPDPSNKKSEQSFAVRVSYSPTADGPLDKAKDKGKG